jgi:hypothetical protein
MLREPIELLLKVAKRLRPWQARLLCQRERHQGCEIARVRACALSQDFGLVGEPLTDVKEMFMRIADQLYHLDLRRTNKYVGYDDHLSIGEYAVERRVC